MTRLQSIGKSVAFAISTFLFGAALCFIILFSADVLFTVPSNETQYVPYSVTTYTNNGGVLETYPLVYNFKKNQEMIEFTASNGKRIIYRGDFKAVRLR